MQWGHEGIKIKHQKPTNYSKVEDMVLQDNSENVVTLYMITLRRGRCQQGGLKNCWQLNSYENFGKGFLPLAQNVIGDETKLSLG